VRILVDATILAAPAAGLRSYVEGLVPALAERAEVTAVVPEGARLRGAEVVRAPASVGRLAARAAWRERHLARLAREARAHVLLAPSPEVPLRGAGVPSIMVVHDVFPFTSPDLVGRAKRLRFRAVFPLMRRRAGAVVAVSDATARAIGGASATIGEGPSPIPEAPPATFARPYVLAVGALYRRKQLDVLLRALPPELDLVLAGPADDEARAALSRDRVRHEGWVTPERLGALYRGAAVYALPSLDEGFGRGLLDAMALGTPAVVSDIPALRELGGDAVRLVSPPTEAAAWTRALAEVAGDGALRERMAARGRELAAGRTWDVVAEQFVALARRLA
jgi:glycosyltransferase involved in cell wall biosynthesis